MPGGPGGPWAHPGSAETERLQPRSEKSWLAEKSSMKWNETIITWWDNEMAEKSPFSIFIPPSHYLWKSINGGIMGLHGTGISWDFKMRVSLINGGSSWENHLEMPDVPWFWGWEKLQWQPPKPPRTGLDLEDHSTNRIWFLYHTV